MIGAVIGMKVRLDRAVDRALGCHDNIALIHPGSGPHAAQLRCAECNRHRGWLAKPTADFLSSTVTMFGVPSEPFVIRDASPAHAGENPMHIDKLFPSKYLGAGDADGEELTLTIDRVRLETIGRNSDEKPVVSFAGEPKKLILNKTNSKAIAELYGPNTDAWHGKQITLFATETEFGGETVDCLRVKAPPGYKKPAAKPKKQLKDDMNDELAY
jgi:hypothetical protein